MKVVGLLTLLLTSAFGEPYSYSGTALYDYAADGVDADGDPDLLETPQFTVQAEDLIVNEGDSIRLPCKVDRLEGFVILWKKSDDIITVATQIIEKKVRLEATENGNILVIEHAKPEDEGVYSCQISAYKPTVLNHTVQIRVAPVISTVPNEVLIVAEGERAAVECEILSGSPIPEITWRRKDERKNGELKKGPKLVFPRISKKQAGSYICQADNGWPHPAEKEVLIEVLYAPGVIVGEAELQTSEGDEEELVCHVSGNPQPDVAWYREGELLDSLTTSVLINSKHGRHSLTVLGMNKKNVGEYQCKVNNTLGETRGVIVVTGLAKEVIILSPRESREKHSYLLEWTVQSKDPVREFIVLVRKTGEKDWEVHTVSVEGKSDVDNESDSDRDRDMYDSSLELKGLEEGTFYQVTVASRNSFGLSKPGHVFTFSSKGADPVQQPMVKNKPSTSSASALLLLKSSSVTFISLLLSSLALTLL